MSFFSRLFGRSKPKEPTEEAPAVQPAPAASVPKVNGKVAPAPISDERAQQIEARAKQDTIPMMATASASTSATVTATATAAVATAPTPSGDASQPAAKKPTSGLFKKRAPSNAKLEAMPNAGLGVAVAAPAKEVQAKVAVTPIPVEMKKEQPAPAATSKDGGVLEALLGNLDKSFDAIIQEQSEMTPPLGNEAEPNTDDFDRLSVLELFYDIATNHLRPVRNFMIELHLGDVRKEWVHIAQPSIKSIQSAAEQINIPELKRALDDFDALLSIAAESSGDTISGDIREELINHYKALQQIMPRAFTLEEERDQRESLIIHSLLMQVPDVRKVTIDKLYRAGLTALEVLFLATTEDLAVTTGIRKILAQRIVDKFQQYRKEVRESVPDAATAGQTNKLRELIVVLEAQQAKYDEAAMSRSIEEKRAHRLARQGTLLEITVVLAQMGEVELVEHLERLPFEKRIERLRSHIDELSAKKG
jgi:hypothetical protein